MRTWVEAWVSVLVCTWGAAFEMDWWNFGGVSVDTTILHTCLFAPACTACTGANFINEFTTCFCLKNIVRSSYVKNRVSSNY